MVVVNAERLLPLLAENKSLAFPLIVLMGKLQPKTNALLVGEKNYGAKSLAEDLGVSRQMSARYLKQLKGAGIVAPTVLNGKTVLMLNRELAYKE